MIDTRVGAHESEAVLDDDGSRPRPQDLPAFLQDQLDQAGVFFRLGCQLHRAGGWDYAEEVYHATFGLRNDLLGEDKDVLIFQSDMVFLKRSEDKLRQMIAPPDERDAQ